MERYIVGAVLLIAIALVIAWLINSVIILIKIQHEEEKINQRYNQLKEENNRTITEYSEKLLNFVKMLTTQVSILKFRSFVDNHEMDKITKANIQKLVAEVAEAVNGGINIDLIDFDDVLFTKEFYEKYIIETSLITIKSLLNQSINEEN